MADFALPILTSTYSDLVDLLKARDVSSMKLFDGTTDSNLPSGTKRWNSTNSYFEKFDGSAWSPLVAKYMINVDLLDGCTVNDGGSTTSDLWTANKIATQLSTKLDASTYTAADILTKIKTVDGSGSGLDADLLDGMNALSTNTASSIVARDASGNFSAGTITATLSGNASTATTATTATTANALNATNSYTVSNLTANASITIGTGGNYVAGSIFSNSAWGMIFRAKQASPTNAIFRWADAADTELFRWNGSALTCSITGNSATATKLTNSSNDWISSGASANVVGMLSWKNYGNGHTIFDASASTAPNGVAVNNTNSASPWSPSYPTLMGWNGSQTYGVRVDAARYSESCTGNAATATALSGAVGSAPSYACRAWVNFNGTGSVSIKASGNVSSITDNGVGNYTINFTTAILDDSYSYSGGANYMNEVLTGGIARNLSDTKTTTRFQFHAVNQAGATAVDVTDIAMNIFR